MAVAAEALAAARKMGQCLFEAGFLQLTGELTLLSGGNGGEFGAQREVEECFHQAFQIARQHSAKSLELRSAISLSRLWQRQGKITEARTLLAEIYHWFTEGFDRIDLKEAKTLLDDLS